MHDLFRFSRSAHPTHHVVKSYPGIVLKGGERFNTPDAFRPPVEITVVAKTDSTNLRLGYAADQVIFNWERDRGQFRVNGGPADRLHKAGAGSIPAGKFVTVRWLVTPRHQAVYVDDELRFEHCGDYSEDQSKCFGLPCGGIESHGKIDQGEAVEQCSVEGRLLMMLIQYRVTTKYNEHFT